MKAVNDWQVYRTRFLIRAKQLTEPLYFVDVLGREHRGQKGDYLVESSDGMRRIAPRELFEDVYVAMEPAATVLQNVGRARHGRPNSSAPEGRRDHSPALQRWVTHAP